ncbi:hypothetical protein O6H91_09G068200 [Diphasiastrum complanatum]|uniref:Uncharacterized protein n=1 Tax=Diphasiastrum complanatum TaxID=34168 RepID=A0ACC2CQ79_DIPCM|nr:hypothetical protein O6H91_09G068200 [Diphasiastrum complanatum]
MVHTKTHACIRRLFGVFVIVLNSLNIALCNVESDALLVQLAALTDPHKVLASWINSFPDPCHWFHVHCDESGHVIIVDLSFEDMSGHIVHELGQLTHLRRLYLNNNRLTGGIPESLTTISTLTQLLLREIRSKKFCWEPATLWANG